MVHTLCCWLCLGMPWNAWNRLLSLQFLHHTYVTPYPQSSDSYIGPWTLDMHLGYLGHAPRMPRATPRSTLGHACPTLDPRTPSDALDILGPTLDDCQRGRVRGCQLGWSWGRRAPVSRWALRRARHRSWLAVPGTQCRHPGWCLPGPIAWPVPAGSSHTAQLPVEEDAAVQRLLMIRAQPLHQGGRHSTVPFHIRPHMFSLSRTLHDFWARRPSDSRACSHRRVRASSLI